MGNEDRIENKGNMENMSFEASIDKLEQIVTQLESGDTLLEQSIELFQEGMMLAKRCSEKLEQAEHKIEMIMEQNGEWKRQPYVTEETGD